MNLYAKILFATLGSALIGRTVKTKIRGTKEEVDAIAKALIASRKLYVEFKSSNATVQTVIDKLNEKNDAAKEFESIFNMQWPL